MFKIEKKSRNLLEITISLNQDEWNACLEKVYEKQKDKFNVMGFRKGHAPRKVIEQTYGEGIFFDDAIDEAIGQNMSVVLDQNPNCEPVSQPEMHLESISKDGITLKISYEIIPDFEVGKHEGLEIYVHDFDVTDGEVDADIEYALEEHAQFVEVDRPAQNGDVLLIDFMGFMDGVQFEGGTAENYSLQIGKHQFVDNFEEQLIGAKAGDKVEVVVNFPKAYFKKDMAGKKASFDVTVKKVREKHLPTLDDKFVADTTEFETLEEYRKATKEHIETMKYNDQEIEYELELMTAIIKNSNIEVPKDYEKFVEQDAVEQIDKMASSYRVDKEFIAKMNGFQTLPEFTEYMKKRAVRGIRSKCIINKLIEEYQVKVPEDEFKKKTEYLYKENDIREIENKLLREEVMKILKAKNKKVPVSDEEFDKKKEM